MARLTSHHLTANTRPAKIQFKHDRATMDDPATTVMTDFARRHAISIRSDQTLREAETVMISAGIRFLLVLNLEGRLDGLLSYRDISGQKATAAAVRENIRHDELAVSSVMTPLAEVEALDFNQLKKANIRELVEHMRNSGRQHALVTETDKSGHTHVRGMFSIVRIGRQLGVNIESGERARSFSEVEQLLAHA